MTDGPVPAAESPRDSSTSTPTDSRMTVLGPEDTFPVTGKTISAALVNAFETGWRAARQLEGVTDPIALDFDLMIDRDTKEVEAFARLL